MKNCADFFNVKIMLFIIIGLCLIPIAFAVKNKKVRYFLLITSLAVSLFAVGYYIGSDRAAIDTMELKNQ